MWVVIVCTLLIIVAIATPRGLDPHGHLAPWHLIRVGVWIVTAATTVVMVFMEWRER